jgi:hypothetical protein
MSREHFVWDCFGIDLLFIEKAINKFFKKASFQTFSKTQFLDSFIAKKLDECHYFLVF